MKQTIPSRRLGKSAEDPACVHYRAVPVGRREAKFAALAGYTLDDADWVDCPFGWRDPFLPAAAGLWARCRRSRTSSFTTARV
jgi:hypothetical protein